MNAKVLTEIFWNEWEKEKVQPAPMLSKVLNYNITNCCLDNIKGLDINIRIFKFDRKSIGLSYHISKKLEIYREHRRTWNYDEIFRNCRQICMGPAGEDFDYGNDFTDENDVTINEKDFKELIEKYLILLKETINSLKYDAYIGCFKLPSTLYIKSTDEKIKSFLLDNYENYECCVCKEEIRATHLTCKHPLCKKCAIHLYFENKDIKCPVCRQNKLSFKTTNF
jgi:hypothetical protein